MNANSSRSHWATLFALLFCVSNVGRLAAEESDDEPTVAVPAASGASDIGYDSLNRTRKKPKFYPGQAKPKPPPGPGSPPPVDSKLPLRLSIPPTI